MTSLNENDISIKSYFWMLILKLGTTLNKKVAMSYILPQVEHDQIILQTISWMVILRKTDNFICNCLDSYCPRQSL